MVYGRYRSRRRSSRSRRRTLSTRSILTRTRSRSQASQILALRKSVSSLRRQVKPDIKVYSINPMSLVYTNSSSGNLLDTPLSPSNSTSPPNANGVWYFEWLNQRYPDQGTGDSNRIADRIRLRDAKVFMEMNYATNMSNSTTTVGANLLNPGCYLRIIVLQGKSTDVGLQEPAGNNILQWFATTGNYYSNLAISPLTLGITERFKVLSDRKYRFNVDNCNRMIKFKIRPYYRTCRYNTSGAADHPIGIAYFVSGLQFSTTVTERLEGTRSLKFTWTDV